MSLGPGVLVSRGRLALLPPFSALVSLPRLTFARSATPFLGQWVGRSLGLSSKVVAPVALLPGIALSPWIIVRCRRHR